MTNNFFLNHGDSKNTKKHRVNSIILRVMVFLWFLLLNRITAVQVCDATDDDSSNTAWRIIYFFFVNNKYTIPLTKKPTNQA